MEDVIAANQKSGRSFTENELRTILRHVVRCIRCAPNCCCLNACIGHCLYGFPLFCYASICVVALRYLFRCADWCDGVMPIVVASMVTGGIASFAMGVRHANHQPCHPPVVASHPLPTFRLFCLRCLRVEQTLGVKCLHKQNLAHLDIKPGNIFIKTEVSMDSESESVSDRGSTVSPINSDAMEVEEFDEVFVGVAGPGAPPLPAVRVKTKVRAAACTRRACKRSSVDFAVRRILRAHDPHMPSKSS